MNIHLVGGWAYPSDKYARQLVWLFPIWWDSHKIPWFQTTKKKWLCPHFWAILQMAKYSFSSGKRRETFKDKPLDGMGYLLFNQSHTVNGCKILHHQKNGWNHTMWGPLSYKLVYNYEKLAATDWAGSKYFFFIFLSFWLSFYLSFFFHLCFHSFFFIILFFIFLSFFLSFFYRFIFHFFIIFLSFFFIIFSSSGEKKNKKWKIAIFLEFFSFFYHFVIIFASGGGIDEK